MVMNSLSEIIDKAYFVQYSVTLYLSTLTKSISNVVHALDSQRSFMNPHRLDRNDFKCQIDSLSTARA
jgi:hypothetical protein